MGEGGGAGGKKVFVAHGEEEMWGRGNGGEEEMVGKRRWWGRGSGGGWGRKARSRSWWLEIGWRDLWEVRAMKNTGIGMEGRARNEWACSTSFLGSMGIRRKGESRWKWELACALVSRDSNFLKRVCVKREEGGRERGRLLDGGVRVGGAGEEGHARLGGRGVGGIGGGGVKIGVGLLGVGGVWAALFVLVQQPGSIGRSILLT